MPASYRSYDRGFLPDLYGIDYVLYRGSFRQPTQHPSIGVQDGGLDELLASFLAMVKYRKRHLAREEMEKGVRARERDEAGHPKTEMQVGNATGDDSVSVLICTSAQREHLSSPVRGFSHSPSTYLA